MKRTCLPLALVFIFMLAGCSPAMNQPLVIFSGTEANDAREQYALLAVDERAMCAVTTVIEQGTVTIKILNSSGAEVVNRTFDAENLRGNIAFKADPAQDYILLINGESPAGEDELPSESVIAPEDEERAVEQTAAPQESETPQDESAPEQPTPALTPSKRVFVEITTDGSLFIVENGDYALARAMRLDTATTITHQGDDEEPQE